PVIEATVCFLISHISLFSYQLKQIRFNIDRLIDYIGLDSFEWPDLVEASEASILTADILCNAFTLYPTAQWTEALLIKFFPKLPRRLKLFDKKTWLQIQKAFDTSTAGQTEILQAASLLLLDLWLYLTANLASSDSLPFQRLA